MGPNNRELSAKENNKPVANLRTFMNVFRPIREWINTTRQPKTSTPISAPILRSNSASGHIRHSINNSNQSNSPRSHNNSTTNKIDNLINNRSSNSNNNNNIINNSANNSYGGDSLTGSSGDMLSTAAPTPTHHQQHLNSLHHQFTPITNGHNGTLNGGGMLSSMDDQLNGSTDFGGPNEVSGMGSTLEINQQFSRSAQARMSLPIMQQNKLRRQAYSQLQQRGQHQIARSMGHIYLQHKGETKQASLPNELTTIDTIRALFVCAFPHMLTMEYMSQPHVKIYIYNPSCNIFYELCDIEDVRHESVLRIHHSDPLGSMALASQVSMVSLGGPTVGPMGHLAHNPYSTLHRLPPRLQSQQQAHQLQQQHQSQQHQPMQQSARASIGSTSMLPQSHHMMQHPIMPQLHHQLPGQPLPQLSHIPPPKPRRMIPASYSMHRLQPHQT